MQNSTECIFNVLYADSGKRCFSLSHLFHLSCSLANPSHTALSLFPRISVEASWTWVKIWIKMSANRSLRPYMRLTATGRAAPRSMTPRTNLFMWVIASEGYSARNTQALSDVMLYVVVRCIYWASLFGRNSMKSSSNLKVTKRITNLAAEWKQQKTSRSKVCVVMGLFHCIKNVQFHFLALKLDISPPSRFLLLFWDYIF